MKKKKTAKRTAKQAETVAKNRPNFCGDADTYSDEFTGRSLKTAKPLRTTTVRTTTFKR